MDKPSKQKVYTTKREKTVDFLVGYIGWFILNGIFALISFGPTMLFFAGDTEISRTIQEFLSSIPADLSSALTIIFNCLPLIINIGLLVYFGFRRAWIAIGGLSAFGTVLALTICAGIAFMAYCFVLLGSGGL